MLTFEFQIVIKKVMLLITTTLFFISCESNFKEVQKINITEINPVGEAQDFNLKYTDSGKIKAVLVSPKMLDFSTAEFPFNEFPKGINLTIYDDNANKSFVTSNYAVSYGSTNIIELTGQVIITTHDGKKLETEQLYYDQKNEWFFTQKPYRFTDRGSIINGIGIDFSKDFKYLDTQQIKGTYNL
ncbi:LPS export ABC transporter periplasmic protein LptC [Flavobacterium amnicola]|jgi:LPS export ABC transporter protein LptC|uniref:LPS export ABC transporter periplasmic protein LptC n=1 Tax=Flavobacterium amnicola TaxID=2506422 RepID=A0A4Q1K420_9FLAO|nr:LPS export ABC transporter periplasmic protein LptC [Flavobacterium amnicola]RXR20573.1 LPS export ABC transporter periplasmic protein LptC [Flavobacterium amnicola]